MDFALFPGEAVELFDVEVLVTFTTGFDAAFVVLAFTTLLFGFGADFFTVADFFATVRTLLFDVDFLLLTYERDVLRPRRA